MKSKIPTSGKKDDLILELQKKLNIVENDLNQIKDQLYSFSNEKEYGNQNQFIQSNSIQDNGKVIEGIFDGQNMISKTGKKYTVSANYASKSKLLAGDKLKLVILDNGTFIYKQISPIKRRKIIGKLSIEKDKFIVEAEDKKYQVLPASITYFKAMSGDKIAISIPEKESSKWAAVEGIIPKE